jgi:hypothetical protein
MDKVNLEGHYPESLRRWDRSGKFILSASQSTKGNYN